MNYLTQIDLFEDSGGYKGFGPLGLENAPAEGAVGVLQQFISTSIGVISIIAIIWFTYILVISGISYMAAGPDQKAAEGARKRIGTGLTGLIITIFGIFLLRLVGEIFDIPAILNLPALVEMLSPND